MCFGHSDPICLYVNLGSGVREKVYNTTPSESTYIIFVLVWWGGNCCPMHCDILKIYCAHPNLGITRTWICRLNFTQRPIFQAWGSLTILKSQTWDSQLKVPPGGLVRPKNIHRSQPDLNPWISRRAHYPETTEADSLLLLLLSSLLLLF